MQPFRYPGYPMVPGQLGPNMYGQMPPNMPIAYQNAMMARMMPGMPMINPFLPKPVIPLPTPIQTIPLHSSTPASATNTTTLNSNTISSTTSPATITPETTNAAGESIEKSTTVFVGKIAESIEDEFLRLILLKCGTLMRWQRVVDEGGVLKSFGYCDFATAEDVERTVRILNKFELDGKELVVNIDKRTKAYIDSCNKQTEGESEDAAAKRLEAEAEKDKKALEGIRDVTRERQERGGYVAQEDLFLADKSLEKSVSSDIHKFRMKQQQATKDKMEELDRRRREPPSTASSSTTPRTDDNRADFSTTKDTKDYKDTNYDYGSNRSARDTRSPPRVVRRSDCEKRERKRLDDRHRAEREREQERKRLQEQLERLQKDLKQTMQRRQVHTEEEARRIEKEHLKQLRASSPPSSDSDAEWLATAQSRKREREKEWEEDELDRLRELKEARDKEEKEERARLAREKMEREERDRLVAEARSRAEAEAAAAAAAAFVMQSVGATSLRPAVDIAPPVDDTDVVMQATMQPLEPAKDSSPSAQHSDKPMRISLGMSMQPAKKKHKGMTSDDDSGVEKMSFASTTPVKQANATEIPSNQDELFAAHVDWDVVDKHDIVEQKLKPWISKKTVELLGEEEPSLIKFVCNKLTAHTSAEVMASNLSVVLDDQAPSFVVRLWRMLLYEISSCAPSS